MSRIALELQYPKNTEMTNTSKRRLSEEPRVTTIPAPPVPPPESELESENPPQTSEETKKGPGCPSRIFGHPAKNSEDHPVPEAWSAKFFALS